MSKLLEDSKSKFKTFLVLLFKHYKKRIVEIDCYVIVAVVYGLISPIAFRYLVNDALGDANHTAAILTIISLFVAYVVATICLFRDKQLSSELGAKLIADIRRQLYQYLDSKKARSQSQQSSKPMTELSLHLAELETFVAHKGSVIIYELMLVVFGFGVLMYLNWQLTLLSLVFIVLLFCLSSSQKSTAVQLAIDKHILENKFVGLVQEGVREHETLRQLSLTESHKEKVTNIIDELYVVAKQYNFRSELAGQLVRSGTQLMLLSIFCAGCVFLLFRLITIGDLVGFILLFFTFCEALATLSLNIPCLVKAEESIEGLKDFIFDEEEAVPEQSSELTFSGLHSAIDISGLTQTGSAQVVCLEAGKQLGVAALSIARTEALVRCFIEKVQPEAGEILFDDQAINSSSDHDYYRQVMVIGHEPIWFEGTIRYNLVIGQHEVDETKFAQYLEALQLTSVIAGLPAGLETLLSVDKLPLNNEQLMRLSLVRMMLRDPSIIILNQTLSVFDVVEVNQVRAVICDYCQGKTLLVVSSDLKHLNEFEACLIIDDEGRMTLAPHQELVEDHQLYKLIWSMQNALRLVPGTRNVLIDPSYLRSIYLFEQVNDDRLLTELAELFTIRRVQANHLIFDEGDSGDEAYVVAYGLVSIEKRTLAIEKTDLLDDELPPSPSSPAQPTYQSIAQLGIGDFFGEIALLRDIPRTAAARALTACYLLTLNYRSFKQFYSHVPEETRQAIDHIANQRLG